MGKPFQDWAISTEGWYVEVLRIVCWYPAGVKLMKAVFSLAAKMAPTVIFLDEVDALLSRRGNETEHSSLREMKNECMALWDGIR